jgi:hypothetical protein
LTNGTSDSNSGYKNPMLATSEDGVYWTAEAIVVNNLNVGESVTSPSIAGTTSSGFVSVFYAGTPGQGFNQRFAYSTDLLNWEIVSTVNSVTAENYVNMRLFYNKVNKFFGVYFSNESNILKTVVSADGLSWQVASSNMNSIGSPYDRHASTSTSFEFNQPVTKSSQIASRRYADISLAEESEAILTNVLTKLGSKADLLNGLVPADQIKFLEDAVVSDNFMIPATDYNDSSYKILISPDGINWTTSANLDSYSASIAYGDGKILLFNSSMIGSVTYSTDGISWTSSPLPWGYSSSVYYVFDKFIYFTGGTTGYVSEDGLTWTQISKPDGYFSAPVYGNNKFVSVSFGDDVNYYRSDKVIYSTDGISWSLATMPFEGAWKSVAYGNGKFVAMADLDNSEVPASESKSAYSTDGIIWTENTSVTTPNSTIAFGSNKFVAARYYNSEDEVSNIIYSTDGVTWTASEPLEDYAGGMGGPRIFYANGRFVLLAYYPYQNQEV